MPTVAREGQSRLVVNTRENQFDPPHVHVWVGNEDVCRIELNSETFMEEPPTGEYRNILEAYSRHAEAIMKTWDDFTALSPEKVQAVNGALRFALGLDE